MATTRRLTVDPRSENVLLKHRIKELENEVSILKRKLEDLRKAKSTTLVKREREIIEVKDPFKRRESSTKTPQNNKQTPSPKSDPDAEWRRELVELRMKAKESEADISVPSCNHEEEIALLEKLRADAEADSAALVVENTELKTFIEFLRLELSLTEAKRSRQEEELKLSIQSTFGEKYREWMRATEAKIEELQEANALLRSVIKKPQGKDPSGQED